MGCSESYQLPPHFVTFQSWQHPRVSSMIKAYVDGEYDWGIDHTVIMSLTGHSLDEAKLLIKSLSRGESVTINAASFLSAVIMLSEPNRRMENSQLSLIFDIFDFGMQGQMSFDEFTIMLLCVITTQGIIMGRTIENPSDAAAIEIAKTMYAALDKPQNSSIALQEVAALYKEYFTSKSVNTMDKVFDRFLLGPDCLQWASAVEEEK
jgi:hypothetical protein